MRRARSMPKMDDQEVGMMMMVKMMMIKMMMIKMTMINMMMMMPKMPNCP